MTASETTDASLSWDVLTIRRPGLTRDLPAGKEELMWVANSSTLISGERDAVLVDTFLTIEQSQTLLDWVVASGKNLTAIYITHGHGDHFFGLASLLERFPRARAVATPEVVKAMHEHLSPAWIENFWRKLFPGQIPDRLLVAEPLEAGELELEGHKLVAVNTGRTDTAHSTCLHVPSIGLIVGGDAVYNGIHPFLGETDRQSRLEASSKSSVRHANHDRSIGLRKSLALIVELASQHFEHYAVALEEGGFLKAGLDLVAHCAFTQGGVADFAPYELVPVGQRKAH